eukprot:jgi/Pico_ML_1/51426/g2458.t1
MAAPPVALAVIGVDDRPLYLEIAQEGGDENLGLHFVLHCALDFVDEKPMDRPCISDPRLVHSIDQASFLAP